MSTFKIGIVEDEFIIAESIRLALESLGYNVPMPASNFSEALKLLETEKPDLLFLDIQLKGEKDGIDLATVIKEQYSVPFIFLTANSDILTVKRAKETNPAAFLIKPFQKAELYAAIEVAMSNHQKISANTGPGLKLEMPDSLFIKDGYYFHKVLKEDIVYLESDDVYVNVVTKELKKILVRTSMKQFIKEHFENSHFFRVSRSHVINLKYLDGINSSYVMVKGQQINIGKNYRDELMSSLGLSN
jgi:DNA-binding LytR/AlgR family response regulator